MLRRKRGRGKGTRKMAKKTVPAALQIDVPNNEEWIKILAKKGLLVVDIYSEWCGPCTGMVSTLKKIKMEIGGDALSYATAKCDNITDLKRFQGKSEPTWMFIHNGMMINLLFGADCPQFVKTLTTEFLRVQNEEDHDFSIPVTERSPEEIRREESAEEVRASKEAAKKAQKEAETKERYEAEMHHLVTSLFNETCVLLYPWVFKDEEEHKRDKKSSPPYVELVEQILPENYSVEKEIRKQLDDDLLNKLFEESNYTLTEHAKRLILDGKCMFMRLKINETKSGTDVHQYLISLLFEQPELPSVDQVPSEECYSGRHRPAFVSADTENVYPVVWTPPNARNKAIVFRLIFNSYINATYPYEDKTTKAPIILFKYDSTRKNELKVILEMYNDEVVNFGVFDCDKPTNAKMIATSIEQFETSIEEKTGYEIFICTVKKVGCEAFLAFAGIGPFHVSDNPDNAIEESKLYFSNITILEEILSDDEDNPEDTTENLEVNETTNTDINFTNSL